jgi:hypothetical protein
VGTGIAELAAVRTLRGWDATAELIGRAPVGPGDGSGIFLPGNASRAPDELGLGVQVAP